MRTGIVLTGLLTSLVVTTIAQQNQPTFRATADYFSTQVTPRDKDGKFVPDLRPEDFRVYEDGVLQTITFFETNIGGRVVGSLGTAAPRAALPVSEGLILPTRRPSNDSSGRIFMIFIDDLHIAPSDTPRAKDLLKKVRDILIKDNDLVGFVSSGTSNIAIDPSYDYGHRRFNEAMNKVMGSGLTPQDILQGAATESAEGPSQLRYNVHAAFQTAYELLDQLALVSDKKKAFVFISTGYDFNPFKDARLQRVKDNYALVDQANGVTPTDQMSEEEKQKQQETDDLRLDEYNHRTEFSNADLISEVAQLGRRAQQANVTFYPIDPRGLIATGDIGGSTQDRIGYADWRDLFQQQLMTLKSLAQDTGGFCTCMTNDFEKGIRRIDAEMSDYYVIGYRSTNPDPLKIRRLVKIEVVKPTVTEVAGYQPEYFLPKPKSK